MAFEICTVRYMIEAGAVPVPVDTQAGEEGLRHIRQDSEARWIFTTASIAGRLATIMPEQAGAGATN